MPRPLPTSPLALAFLAYRVWRRLPASQRRRLLAAAVVHGPRLAAQARRSALRTAAGSAGRRFRP